MPKDAHFALISLTSILLVLLLGAVVVMGSLIHQFVSGRSNLNTAGGLPESTGSVMIGPAPNDEAQLDSATSTSWTTESLARSVIPSLCTVQGYGEGYESKGGFVGVVITADGYIVTTLDAVDGAAVLSVVLSGGDSLEPAIVATDKTTGIAVLKVNAQNLRYAEIGDSSTVTTGNSVVAFGIIDSSNIVVAEGIVGTVSSFEVETERPYGRRLNYIVTDSTLAADFNNTVLINRSGQVVGISGAKVAGGSSDGRYTLLFNEVLPVVNSMVSYGYVAGRAALGLDTSNIDAATAAQTGLPAGVRVDAVLRDDSSLKEGDVITAIDGVAVTNAAQLETEVSVRAPGATARLSVFRPESSETMDIDLVLLEDNGS